MYYIYSISASFLLSAGYTAYKPNPFTTIICITLAALFGYERHIQSQKLPSTQKALEDLKKEFQNQLEQQKAEHHTRISILEDELAKQAIAKANSSSSSKTGTKTAAKVVF